MAELSAAEKLARLVSSKHESSEITVTPECLDVKCGSLKYIEHPEGKGAPKQQLEIDGQVVRGVYRMEITADVNEITRIKLYLYSKPEKKGEA